WWTSTSAACARPSPSTMPAIRSAPCDRPGMRWSQCRESPRPPAAPHSFPARDCWPERGVGTEPTPRVLQAVEAFADKDIHRHAAVLGLAFNGVIGRQRICLGHPGGGQHTIGLPAAGLLEIVDDAAG